MKLNFRLSLLLFQSQTKEKQIKKLGDRYEADQLFKS